VNAKVIICCVAGHSWQTAPDVHEAVTVIENGTTASIARGR